MRESGAGSPNEPKEQWAELSCVGASAQGAAQDSRVGVRVARKLAVTQFEGFDSPLPPSERDRRHLVRDSL